MCIFSIFDTFLVGVGYPDLRVVGEIRCWVWLLGLPSFPSELELPWSPSSSSGRRPRWPSNGWNPTSSSQIPFRSKNSGPNRWIRRIRRNIERCLIGANPDTFEIHQTRKYNMPIISNSESAAAEIQLMNFWGLVNTVPESLVGDSFFGETSGAEINVVFGGVKNVGDSDLIEVLHIFDGGSGSDDDSGVDFVAIESQTQSFPVIPERSTSGHQTPSRGIHVHTPHQIHSGRTIRHSRVRRRHLFNSQNKTFWHKGTRLLLEPDAI